MTTMEHYKECYVESYGHIVILRTYKNLTAGELRIIYQYEMTKDPNMPKNISDIYLINTTGEECLRRENLKLKLSFMGNKMGVFFGDDDPAIEIMDRKLMATVLNLHTARMDHLEIEQSNRALEVLKLECVDFYLQLFRYNQRIELAAS